MLKREKLANIRTISETTKKDMEKILKVIDKTDGSILFEEFKCIYLDSELYTLESIANKLDISLNGLHRHLKKINAIIDSVVYINHENESEIITIT